MAVLCFAAHWNKSKVLTKVYTCPRGLALAHLSQHLSSLPHSLCSKNSDLVLLTYARQSPAVPFLHSLVLLLILPPYSPVVYSFASLQPLFAVTLLVKFSLVILPNDLSPFLITFSFPSLIYRYS